jgi:hypothetical protein
MIKQAEADGSHRGDLLQLVEEARVAFGSDPGEDARYEYARVLMEAGDFVGSQETVAPLLDAAKPSPEAVRLAAKLAYLSGDYARAEELYSALVREDAGDPGDLGGLVFTYYQTNRFESCADLPAERLSGMRLPVLDVMLAFGQEAPYTQEWSGDRRTEIPFVSNDPLPMVEVQVDGRTVTALIDTGADLFILDTDVAAELGVEPVTSMMGMFAGGKTAEIGFSRVESLRLGGVTLRNVPVSTLPTKPLSLAGVEIEGIVGVAVLRQFLTTLDYPNDRIVLRERTEPAREAFLSESGERVLEEMPFYLQSSHSILAHGSLNGRGDMLFRIDSGLAGEPAFGAPEQTLRYVGIPVPEVEVREDVVGGAGGGFAVGQFEIESLAMGRLEQRDLVGSFGGQPPGSYRRSGFIVDGLLSHNFLKQYAWTLDFDAMTMYFVRGA